MRKILVLLILLISTISAYSKSTTDIEFDTPDGFRTDTISADRLIVEGDSAIAYVQFLSIPNLDKDKAKAAHDSVFVNVVEMELIEADMDGSADVINKYFDAKEKKYVKVYRHLHFDGLTYIFAVNNTDDFAWSDTIDNSYHKGLRWYWIVLYVVASIIWVILCIGAADNFLRNWPRFIVCAVLAIALLLICGFVLGWELALLLFGLFLVIGIAARCGFVIIPV